MYKRQVEDIDRRLGPDDEVADEHPDGDEEPAAALAAQHLTEVVAGVVAMVAMTPLITVQLMGLVAQLKTRKARSAQPLLDTAALLADLPDDAIIEL